MSLLNGSKSGNNMGRGCIAVRAGAWAPVWRQLYPAQRGRRPWFFQWSSS